MSRMMKMLACLLAVCCTMPVVADQPPKFEKPQKGMGRYVLVLWEPGTPVPGQEANHMPKFAEPDLAKLGGVVLTTNGNWRLVDLPVKEATKLRKHEAVATVQRLWMGEPLEEFQEDPDDSRVRARIISENDVDVDWGPKGYGYDKSGNITSIGLDSFVYDSAGRLIRSSVEGKTERFKYDQFGNLIEKAIDGGSPVVIPVDGGSNRMIGANYDVRGNVTERISAAAANADEQFEYDPMNMLVLHKDSAAHRSMIYDADDERIGADLGGSPLRWWIRDFDGSVLREYKSDSVGGYWYWEQDWVYADGQLVGGERVKFSALNEDVANVFGGKRHYHLDHLGSVRVVTNDLGRSTSEHDYFAFGTSPTKAYQEQMNWGDPHIDAMRFAGHQREFMGVLNIENTNYLDYMHARYYDPNAGRFLSVDPGDDVYLSQPQSWNKYSYVRNNPVRFIDPTGLRCQPGEELGPDGCGSTVTAPDPGPSWSMNSFLGGSSNSHQLDRLKGFTRAILDKPWVLSWIVPVAPEPGVLGVGPAGSVAYNPQTHTICVGVGLGASAGHNISIGPILYTSKNPLLPSSSGNIDDILAGWSLSGGANTPFPTPGSGLGAQVIGNSSGIAVGPTIGMSGTSISSTYSGCVGLW